DHRDDDADPDRHVAIPEEEGDRGVPGVLKDEDHRDNDEEEQQHQGRRDAPLLALGRGRPTVLLLPVHAHARQYYRRALTASATGRAAPPARATPTHGQPADRTPRTPP